MKSALLLLVAFASLANAQDQFVSVAVDLDQSQISPSGGLDVWKVPKPAIGRRNQPVLPLGANLPFAGPGDTYEIEIRFRGGKALLVDDPNGNIQERFQFLVEGENAALYPLHYGTLLSPPGIRTVSPFEWEFIVCESEIGKHIGGPFTHDQGRFFSSVNHIPASYTNGPAIRPNSPTSYHAGPGWHKICAIRLRLEVPPNSVSNNQNVQWHPTEIELFDVQWNSIEISDCPESFVKDDPHFQVSK